MIAEGRSSVFWARLFDAIGLPCLLRAVFIPTQVGQVADVPTVLQVCPEHFSTPLHWLGVGLAREASIGSIELKEAWAAISRSQFQAPLHLFGTSEVDSWAGLRFRADIACVVCGLSLARHSN